MFYIKHNLSKATIVLWGCTFLNSAFTHYKEKDNDYILYARPVPVSGHTVMCITGTFPALMKLTPREGKIAQQEVLQKKNVKCMYSKESWPGPIEF